MSTANLTSAPRPRIIERWFPTAEVSAASQKGWGSSNSETLLMPWFAKRPLAQARAAVLCSLLPWPEDEGEQKRVQTVVREALGACQDLDYVVGSGRAHAFEIVDCARYDDTSGYNAARRDVIELLDLAYPDRPSEMLDPFSGRGLIPLEAARYGQKAIAIDYSPVAALASRLLIDWPLRDWSTEPELPFDPPARQARQFDPDDPNRLVQDIETVQAEVQRRWAEVMDPYYPDDERGEKPWGYLWAATIPCNGCGRWFPLYGSNTLRKPGGRDGGQSFEIVTEGDDWLIRLEDGVTGQPPTMHARPGKRGKLAWCPFSDCGHAHELPEHKRLVQRNYGEDVLLVVADVVGTDKHFRLPLDAERDAATTAAGDLAGMTLGSGLSARPDERPLQGTDRIGGVIYGAEDFGDLSLDRQNLAHAQLAQTIAAIADDIIAVGCSSDYAQALTGYCGATFVKKLMRSTKGAALEAMSTGGVKVNNIFVNEAVVGFNYDFFETGIGSGPATWMSVAGVPLSLRLLCNTEGQPANVQRGSALSLWMRDGTLDAVVTDPPYDMMITYSDASDLFFVWLKRALGNQHFDFATTANPLGTQEKSEEIIVHKHHSAVPNEHRTPEFYDTKIAEAFAECRRVVHDDGVVSIVFGHGEPDVWKRLLDAISKAGLVLTGAWPANTEKGGSAGSANINTTLTLACRPAPSGRPDGRVAEVDAEMRRVIADRVRNLWEPSGLSYVDQKMAAAGPALEVVGRYERILDKAGRPVDLTRYLPLARRAVTEAHDLRFDSLPLGTFDPPTQFALEWVRSHGRQVQAASEARWQRLAADLEDDETEAVLKDVPKGVRLVTSSEAGVKVEEGSPLFEVALAAAAEWRAGSLAEAAAAIADAGVDPSDQHFWACINALSKALPETDPDGQIWVRMVRNRDAVVSAVTAIEASGLAAEEIEEQRAAMDRSNPKLFEDPDSLFGQEGN